MRPLKIPKSLTKFNIKGAETQENQFKGCPVWCPIIHLGVIVSGILVYNYQGVKALAQETGSITGHTQLAQPEEWGVGSSGTSALACKEKI